MDINFDISQIYNYSFFVNNVAEEISVSFSQIQSFFSDTQASYESIKTKLKEFETVVLDLFQQASFINNLIVKKLEKMPVSKECLEKPKEPNYSKDNLVKEKQKLIYEKACNEIEKVNNKIKNENEINTEISQELLNLNQNCEKLLQRLEMMISRCNVIKGLISESQSNFVSQKNECEFDIKDTLNLVNQTCEAINNTYINAMPLVEESRHGRVYGNLHKIFKLKPNKNQETFFEENSNLLNEDDIINLKNENNKKIVTIKCKDIEELKKEIIFLNLSKGDVVKIPSYNLFNLGGENFFDEMKDMGFKIAGNNGYEILEDGTIEWGKYE